MRWLACILCFVAPFVARSQGLRAEVRLPAVIGSHMVLQRDQDVPIWGWAASDEIVTVNFGGVDCSATADQTGRWQVVLPKLFANSEPQEMSIEGSSGSRIQLSDILVGEVWFCTGPSNIYWPVKKCDNPEQEIRDADFPRIRFFTVEKTTADEPRDDCAGRWFGCSPDTVGDVSGIGYFFSRRILQDQNVPVGLLQSFWGGSRIEAWTSRAALEAEPALAPVLNWWEQELQGVEARTSEPRTSPHRPACLYNGMVAPLIPFSIRGVICYQGLGNLVWTDYGAVLLETMIRDWRTRWGQGGFPVGLVQPAPFDCSRWPTSGPDAYSLQREAQLIVQDRVANVGIAPTMDVDAVNVVHFTNKQLVADRLARWALGTVYGNDVPYAGPLYESMAVEGNTIQVRFRNAGAGLATSDGRPPAHFEVAGVDGKYFPASSRIDGQRVHVWSEHVANPASVRFAFADTAVVNLMNSDGLPASLFRATVISKERE